MVRWGGEGNKGLERSLSLKFMLSEFLSFLEPRIPFFQRASSLDVALSWWELGFSPLLNQEFMTVLSRTARNDSPSLGFGSLLDLGLSRVFHFKQDLPPLPQCHLK